jgi:hypothetical protein
VNLEDYRTRMERGASAKDVAYELAADAADLAVKTQGQDDAIPVLLGLAHVAMLGALVEAFEDALIHPA